MNEHLHYCLSTVKTSSVFLCNEDNDGGDLQGFFILDCSNSKVQIRNDRAIFCVIFPIFSVLLVMDVGR